MKILYSVLGSTCMGLLAGCGGDAGSAPTRVDTGIAEDKALSSVTSAEAQSACESMRDAMQHTIDQDAILNLFCTLMSASSTSTEGACNDARAECLDQYRDRFTGAAEEVDFECDGDPSEFEGCDVTVGVLESCLNDTLAAFDAVLNRYSCKDAGQIDEGERDELTNFDIEPPASCQPLEDQCDGAGVITAGGDDEPSR